MKCKYLSIVTVCDARIVEERKKETEREKRGRGKEREKEKESK